MKIWDCPCSLPRHGHNPTFNQWHVGKGAHAHSWGCGPASSVSCRHGSIEDNLRQLGRPTHSHPIPHNRYYHTPPWTSMYVLELTPILIIHGDGAPPSTQAFWTTPFWQTIQRVKENRIPKRERRHAKMFRADHKNMQTLSNLCTTSKKIQVFFAR